MPSTPTRPSVPDEFADAGDHIFGEPAAPVTVLEYGDYECPYCRATAPVLHDLITTSDGHVRLVFRNFPLADVHPYALTAALAAEAAGELGVFWPMHWTLFRNQDRLADADLKGYADALGVDGSLVVGENVQRFAAKVQRDFARGLEIGVRGTPWLLINGDRYAGPTKLDAMRDAISGLTGNGLAPGKRGQRERRGLFGFRRTER
jgi:protein-disulfide isomerase